MISELKRLIDQVSREKGIDRQTLISALEEAIKSAIKKKYGSRMDLDVTFNEEFGELDAFQFKAVVEKVTDPDKEIVALIAYLQSLGKKWVPTGAQVTGTP